MDKHIKMSAGADLDFLGYKASAGLLEILHGLRKIRHMNGDVMQSFAALLHNLAITESELVASSNSMRLCPT